MKILAACHRLDWTGAPLILFRLLRALSARHEVTLLEPRDPNDGGPLRALYEEAGVLVVKSVRPGDFDVLLANTLMTSHLARHAARDIPVLWWIQEPRNGLHAIRHGAVDLETFKDVDLICTPTIWQRDTLYAPYLGETDRIVVPYGRPSDQPTGRRPPEMEADGFHIITLGYLSRRKGQAVVIEALSRLNHGKVHLHLLGSETTAPKEAAAILELADRVESPEHRIHFHGARPQADVVDFLARGDVFVFPTLDDLLSISILEAMSQRICVIASDFGAIPELVVDGETGLLFPKADAGALAAKLATAIDDPALRRRLGEAGHRAATVKHDFADHVAGMEEGLARAVANRAARDTRPA
jgi:glycosyltransferase involved in cell wall biosynthesis